jgi:hypothetical protein
MPNGRPNMPCEEQTNAEASEPPSLNAQLR